MIARKNATPLMLFALLAALAAKADPAIAPVIVLANGSGESDVQDPVLTDTFSLARPAVLSVSAYGTARGQGIGGVNAGTTTTISINNEICARDRNLEGTTSDIIFSASASCTRLLQPGTYTLEISRRDQALNTQFFLTYDYVAILAVDASSTQFFPGTDETTGQ